MPTNLDTTPPRVHYIDTYLGVLLLLLLLLLVVVVGAQQREGRLLRHQRAPTASGAAPSPFVGPRTRSRPLHLLDGTGRIDSTRQNRRQRYDLPILLACVPRCCGEATRVSTRLRDPQFVPKRAHAGGEARKERIPSTSAIDCYPLSVPCPADRAPSKKVRPFLPADGRQER